MLVFVSPVVCAAQAASDNASAPSWGPAINSTAPPIDAPDQHGNAQALRTLVGPNGLLLFFVRSADW
jgi:hypothetical protein